MGFSITADASLNSATVLLSASRMIFLTETDFPPAPLPVIEPLTVTFHFESSSFSKET